MHVTPDHPRYVSLSLRERLIQAHERGIVSIAGLIAHGRGEAFDYLLGEYTHGFAIDAIEAMAANIVLARHPVFVVNGNVAGLVAEDVVALSREAPLHLEVNLFTPSAGRTRTIVELIEGLGGVAHTPEEDTATLPGVSSSRSSISVFGLGSADFVVAPLQDGDMVHALKKAGMKTATIDLNPLSRSAHDADITVVDNITRAVPLIRDAVRFLKKRSRKELEVISRFDKEGALHEAHRSMTERYR